MHALTSTAVIHLEEEKEDECLDRSTASPSTQCHDNESVSHPKCTPCSESPLNASESHDLDSTVKSLTRRDSGVGLEWLQAVDPKLRNPRFQRAQA
ncbi:hypothetical protein TSMEX_001809 [Taenia solium]|eukprot:TsM_000452900 transcript=TsM_000452900 gene=TsM_000452900